MWETSYPQMLIKSLSQITNEQLHQKAIKCMRYLLEFHEFETCRYLIQEGDIFDTLCENPNESNLKLLHLIFQIFDEIELSINTGHLQILIDKLNTSSCHIQQFRENFETCSLIQQILSQFYLLMNEVEANEAEIIGVDQFWQGPFQFD